MATQNWELKQDTEVRFPFRPTLERAVQMVPLNVTAFPVPSTAAQKPDVGHDTEVRPPEGSIEAGAVHAEPLKVRTSPLLSTAARQPKVEQDTESRRPLAGSMLVGAPQPKAEGVNGVYAEYGLALEVDVALTGCAAEAYSSPPTETTPANAAHVAATTRRYLKLCMRAPSDCAARIKTRD